MTETRRPHTPLLRRQRLRISSACEACRLRKTKCNGGRPACVRCRGLGRSCTYSRDSKRTFKPSVGQAGAAFDSNHALEPVPASAPLRTLLATDPTCETDTPSKIEASPAISESFDRTKDPDSYEIQSDYTHTTHGQFASQVATAIDLRAGIVPTTPSASNNPVPFVDAPLFGDIDLSHPPQWNVIGVCSESELPPRAYADRLIGIYWRYLHPVEPILDQERFSHAYETAYSKAGVFLHADRDVWLSIIYSVFSLAVQRQETIPFRRRDEEANRYFQHAWELLRPEAILWKRGSPELVQCLMLMNRYLHCTDNQHRTWVTSGLAVRIAQNLLHDVSEASLNKESSKDRQLKQNAWLASVAQDRCVSWALGRTSALCVAPLEVPNDDNSSLTGRHALKLHEIGNQIQLAQVQTRERPTAESGLPRLYQGNQYYTVAIQLDECLNNWERDLPSDWKMENLRNEVSKTSRIERYLLNFRFLHFRLFLYRPILARIYSTKSPSSMAQATSKPSSLNDRLLKECAARCIEEAQRLTSLIVETLEPDDSMGLLPWWYRIYFLHIAGTHFLAAMFSSDLFTESVSKSWKIVLSTLRAHEHLCVYVQQCIRTFETLSTRILSTRSSTLADKGDEPFEGILMDDAFQDIGFDFDSFLFGADDFIQPSDLSF